MFSSDTISRLRVFKYFSRFCSGIKFKNDEDVQQHASGNFYTVPQKLNATGSG